MCERLRPVEPTDVVLMPLVAESLVWLSRHIIAFSSSLDLPAHTRFMHVLVFYTV